MKSLFLKLYATKPVLNLLRPSASLTWNDAVSNSKALRDEIFSRFLILFSNEAISRIVNLRLSFIFMNASFTSYKYGG